MRFVDASYQQADSGAFTVFAKELLGVKPTTPVAVAQALLQLHQAAALSVGQLMSHLQYVALHHGELLPHREALTAGFRILTEGSDGGTLQLPGRTDRHRVFLPLPPKHQILRAALAAAGVVFAHPQVRIMLPCVVAIMR
jgi:hypothetical protein